ncbi:hypothetical protein KGP95_13605 [Burkholderia multivorans]|uniref:hypothetical protein n=1 Tax=Burkholderia multivorans TaxID=87883 RepID=UPI00209CE983|nr:hypothetical protein [Burkholderia multivorans]MCO8609741.1 hypothetical protein [Burkholderia multivorans]MCO8638366.1 hypothetical protein [Burkholderia multivorans]MCO8644590.1 hypothetical protein [Burkholderia multivorans]
MYRIDDATAATSLPVPESAGTEGFFTEGNPATGTPATKVRGSWLNMIQEELCAVLAAAGIARSKTTYNQVNSALQKMYSPIVGSARNLAMNVPAASATATLTADQIVVASALNGQTFIIPSFNKTINLATTGAGGMDVGSAPASGFVALYAIYNPSTGASALLATNATSTVAPNVYGGANMPAGYTASALVTVWPTNSSSQFAIGYQLDRRITITSTIAVSTTTQIASLTLVNAATIIPKNAKTASGNLSIVTANGLNAQVNIAANASGLGAQQLAAGASSGGTNSANCPFLSMPIITAQSFYWNAFLQTGTFTSAQVVITGYEI